MSISLSVFIRPCTRQKAFITLGSPVVPLLSTSKADSGLASEFRRDRAIYTAYERMLKVTHKKTDHKEIAKKEKRTNGTGNKRNSAGPQRMESERSRPSRPAGEHSPSIGIHATLRCYRALLITPFFRGHSLFTCSLSASSCLHSFLSRSMAFQSFPAQH